MSSDSTPGTRANCENCGVEFTRPKKKPRQRFCGVKCGTRWVIENRRPCTTERPCVTCGKIFLCSKPDVDKCSYKCGRLGHMYKVKDPKDRFYKYVDKGAGCWEWKGHFARNGYGRFTAHPGRSVIASRFSWELEHGVIPDGAIVCHKCDNPKCVRPDHLFLGTNRDNVDDCVRKGRNTKGEMVGTAKLTADAVRGMRERYASGESQRKLALAFGVSQSTVWGVCNRILWKHVP